MCRTSVGGTHIFEHAGVNDEHNKICQGLLYLEKKLLTKIHGFVCPLH